jgi:hypothetical protein
MLYVRLRKAHDDTTVARDKAVYQAWLVDNGANHRLVKDRGVMLSGKRNETGRNGLVGNSCDT